MSDVYERERAHLEKAGWFDIKGDFTANPDGCCAPIAAADADTATLTDRIAELELENEELKKKLPETDIDKMAVPELRAHLAYRDVAYDGSKDKKADLVELAKKAAKPE